MAKITTGPLVAEIRGMCGDVIFSRNRGGMISRSKSVRVKPWTQAQIDIRNFYAYLGALWNAALTDAQRDAWRAYAPSLTNTDQLGQSAPMSGQQAFNQANYWPSFLETAYVLDPPPSLFVWEPPDVTLITATTSPEDLELTLSRQPEATEAFILTATRSLNVGRQPHNPDWCFATAVAGPQTYPLDITTAYRVYHPALVPTKRIAIRVQSVEYNMGNLSRSKHSTTIIA